MEPTGEEPGAQQARAARERIAVVVRRMGGGLLKLSPHGIVVTLCACALISLTSGNLLAAGADVLGGVGGNVLADVLIKAADALRRRTSGRPPTQEELEAEVVARLLARASPPGLRNGRRDWPSAGTARRSPPQERNGRLLVSASADRTIRLWDVTTGRQLGQPLVGHTDTVWMVALSPDARLLASAGRDRTIRLWDVATGRQLGRPLTGHREDVSAVAFTPDGRTLVSTGYDKTIRLWNVSLPAVGQENVCALTQRALTRQEWGLYVPGRAYEPVCAGP